MESIAINNRYIVHEAIGAGGMGAVYRAADRLTGVDVALKQVTVPPQQLMFASRAGASNLKLALAQEFKTLASLRHPHIVSVRDYGFDRQQQPFFTMDLLEDAQTIVEAGQGQPLDVQIDLLLQLLQALAYLHRRGVLHRDLKPGNVMVVDGRVKVLDFGLSLVSEHSVADISQTTTGTFAYMAPELFQGLPPSRRSDLYAVGMLAYEIFAGEHPFDQNNLAMLIQQVLAGLVPIEKVGENTELVGVVQQLLDRDPDARYRSARDTIKAFCEATDTPLPPETAAIRESYLQAAKFVGRDEELAALTGALKKAIDGSGSAWLVGGESGVGKTRLCDELQTLALVEGMTVLRGQTVSEGGALFQSWSEPLRRLSLSPQINDQQAAAFKPVIGDIERLVGRPVPDPPPVDAVTGANRFFSAVVELLFTFETPVLVLIEDLQWAGSAALTIFSRLAGRVSAAPILLVGNFRDDEAPDLPGQVPSAGLIKLERLVDEEIADLSTAMLGREIGADAQVLDLLRRETEGNPFFVVEVARTLAEEAGQLAAIGGTELPQEVFARGVREILQARLARVPEDYRWVLDYAALIGRRLDPSVLEQLAGGVELGAWVQACADLAILDYQPGGWRFAHDRLREEVVEGLGKDVRPSLHAEIAEAMEAAYPHAPDQYAALAYHWRAAEDSDKELEYASRAGEHAFQNTAYPESIAHLERALTVLLERPADASRDRREAKFRLMLGSAYSNSVSFAAPELYNHLIRIRELKEQVEDPVLYANMLDNLFTYYEVKAQYSETFETISETVELAKQVGSDLIMAVANNQYALIYFYLGQFEKSREHAEETLALMDEASEAENLRVWGFSHRATSAAWLYSNLILLGYPDSARIVYQDTLARMEQLDFPYATAIYCFIANVPYIARDDELDMQATRKILTIAVEHDLAQPMANGLYMQAHKMVRDGKAAEGLLTMQGVLDQVKASGMVAIEHGLVYRLIDALVVSSDYRKALEKIEEALSRAAIYGFPFFDAELYRFRGECLLALGHDEQQIEEDFEKAIKIAQEQKARWWELRATVSLARLLQTQGRSVEAHERLAAIYGWFTEGFETADLKEARALLT